LELNDAFHREIVHLAKSAMLQQTLDRHFTLPFGSPGALVNFHPMLAESSHLYVISQEHHYRIIESICKRQGARAESLNREHAQLSRRNFEIVLAQTDSLRSLRGGSLIFK
jgi:GntR family transcriptional regulator, vanillate catabolism transcriptional regulator